MKVEIFTDGMYSYESEVSMAAYIILIDGRVVYKTVELIEQRTQNYAELYAITNSLLKLYDIMKEKNIRNIESMQLYSDSENVINLIERFKEHNGKSFMKNSKQLLIKNQECLRIIHVISMSLVSLGTDVKFYHIIAHANSKKKRFYAYKRFMERYNEQLSYGEYDRITKYNKIVDWMLSRFIEVYKK